MKGSYKADQFGFLRTPYGRAWWKNAGRRAVPQERPAKRRRRHVFRRD